MTLYDIDRQIESLYETAVDQETGEIKPEAIEALQALQMERDAKIENVALWHKNTASDIKALADEIKALQERKRRLESKLDWMDGFLTEALDGQRFETPKVSISYRKSQSVEIDDVAGFIRGYKDNPDLVKTEWTPNKVGIKALIKSGTEIMGARLIEKQNMQIK